MIALERVDLPEPLGPISAWISPERTVRSTPLRISLSPADTWRFLISRSAMGNRFLSSRGERGERDQLGERGALEGLDDAELHPGPEKLGGAGVRVGAVVAGDAPAVRRLDEAVHRRDRTLEREHDLVHRDLLGGLGEQVAAVRAAR